MQSKGSHHEPLHPWAEQYLRSLIRTSPPAVPSQNAKETTNANKSSARSPLHSTSPSSASSSSSLLLQKLKCKTTLFSPSILEVPPGAHAPKRTGGHRPVQTEEQRDEADTKHFTQSHRERVRIQEKTKMQERLLQTLFPFVEQQPHYLKQTMKQIHHARTMDRASRDYSTHIASGSSFYISLALLPVTVLRRTLLFFVDHVQPARKEEDGSREVADAGEELSRVEAFFGSPPLRVELASCVVQVLADEKLQQKMRTPLWSLLARQHHHVQERFRSLVLTEPSFLEEAFGQDVEKIAAELLSLPKDLLFEEHLSQSSPAPSSSSLPYTEKATSLNPQINKKDSEDEMSSNSKNTDQQEEKITPNLRGMRRGAALPCTLYTCERGEHFQFRTTSPAMALWLTQCCEARFQTLYTSRPEREGAADATTTTLQGLTSSPECAKPTGVSAHFVPVLLLGKQKQSEDNNALDSNGSAAEARRPVKMNRSQFAKEFVPLLSEMCQIRMCVAFLLELELVWRSARELREKEKVLSTAARTAEEEVELIAFLRRVFHLIQKRHIALLLSATQHGKRFQKKFSISVAREESAQGIKEVEEENRQRRGTPIQYNRVQALFQDFRSILKQDKVKDEGKTLSNPAPQRKESFFYKVKVKDNSSTQQQLRGAEEVLCTRANTSVPWPFVLQFSSPSPPAPHQGPTMGQREEARVHFTLKPFKAFHEQLPPPLHLPNNKPFSGAEKQQLKQLQALLQRKGTLVHLCDGAHRSAASCPVKGGSFSLASKKHMRLIWKTSVRVRLFVKR